MELPQRHKNPSLVLLYPHAPALFVQSAQVWLVKSGDVSLQVSSMKKVSLLRSNAERVVVMHACVARTSATIFHKQS
jgi:hypothetical protein